MQKRLIYVVLTALLSLGIFWFPFIAKTGSFWGIDFGHKGMEIVIQNFDGLNFLVVAKSLYDPKIIETINAKFLTDNNPLYFTAHYPGFPLIIRFFDTFLPGTYALLSAIIVSNTLFAAALYLFFRTVTKNGESAMWLSILALFLPPRMLSDRSVGSNEPLFIALTLLSLYFAYKSKHWMSAVIGSAAILTRSPGILLFGAYAAAIIFDRRKDLKQKMTSMLPYLSMPATLIAIWGFYGYRFHDPLAYFKSGVSLNMHVPPFLAFGTHQTWVTGMWRDDIFYVYLIFGIGLMVFVRKYLKKESFGSFAAAIYGTFYLISLFFVAHRDIARYSLPLMPIAMAGFGENLLDKRIRYLLLALIIPAFLLGWQFVLQNVQVINDWTPLL